MTTQLEAEPVGRADVATARPATRPAEAIAFRAALAIACLWVLDDATRRQRAARGTPDALELAPCG
jgi:hypothetical protein